MVDFAVDCLEVRAVHYAAAPLLGYRLRITELSGVAVHTIVLRTQIRLEPQRRGYSDAEAELLEPLFGSRDRWGETLRPLQFATASTMVPGFTGSVEVTVEVPCSFDLEVTAGSYFHAVREGEVPMVLMFSGTVFTKGGNGFQVHPVPWHLEARARMPVAVWDELMHAYFAGQAWLRLPRTTVDALLRYKSAHGMPTVDAVLHRLLTEVPT